MKYIIFDAGPLISLTMNGLLPIVEKLKENFNGEFVITPAVKKEVIDRPMTIKKYKFEAIQVQDLLTRGVIKMSREFVSDQKLQRETKRVSKITNGVLRTAADKKKISIIHDGEAECLAFSSICNAENVIAIDERTTRLLGESPQNLKKLMERKLHTNLVQELSLLNDLKSFKFIRSTELLFVAYKKNLLNLKPTVQLLDAILYGLKFKGTAISSQEIEEMKRLV